MRRFLGAVVLAAAAGCSDSAGPEATFDQAVVSAPTEITLRLGQELTVPQSVLRLGFVRVVEDSRCPITAICIWMGDGVAELSVASGTGPASLLRVHSSLEPHAADWNGVKVTLLELSPAPLGQPIPAEEYAVRLRVESLER